MSPVFGLQAVLGSETPASIQYQLGEPALGESIHDAHAEARRGAVERKSATNALYVFAASS